MAWVVVGVIGCAASAPRPEVVAISTTEATDAALVSAPEAGAPLSYSDDASSRFEQAEERIHARDLDEARALFVQLKARFAYSRYAPLSELRIADIDYANGDYATAANEYSTFAHDHPTHASAPAALLRAATARCRARDGGACKDDYDGGL